MSEDAIYLPARLGRDLEDGNRQVPPKGRPATRWPPHLRQLPSFLMVPARNSGQEHTTSNGAAPGGGGGVRKGRGGSCPAYRDDLTVPYSHGSPL